MISYAIGDSESLIARNGSGIEKLADIKGKRVAVPVGSTAHFSLMGAIAHGDIVVSKEKIEDAANLVPDQIKSDIRFAHARTADIRLARFLTNDSAEPRAANCGS